MKQTIMKQRITENQLSSAFHKGKNDQLTPDASTFINTSLFPFSKLFLTEFSDTRKATLQIHHTRLHHTPHTQPNHSKQPLKKKKNMHFATLTLTTLLLPLLLSSVLATPIPAEHDNVKGDALAGRQTTCGPGISADQCGVDDLDSSWSQAAEEGEDPNA